MEFAEYGLSQSDGDVYKRQRQEQIENLKRLKEGRNQAEVDKALEAITECVKTGKGN